MPEFQRQGVGTALCKAGLKIIEQAGMPFVVVLGHPNYFLLVGFAPAARTGLAVFIKRAPIMPLCFGYLTQKP